VFYSTKLVDNLSIVDRRLTGVQGLLAITTSKKVVGATSYEILNNLSTL